MKRKVRINKVAIFTLITIILVLIVGCTLALNYLGKDSVRLKMKGYSSKIINKIIKDEEITKYALNNKKDNLLIELINVDDFKFSNLDKYKSYKKDNKDVTSKDLVYLVNNDYTEYDYSTNLIEFINSKYYLKTRLDRYLTYQEDHQDLEVKEIIKRVNSNIDYDFYTNVEKTDTSYGYQMICNKHYNIGTYVPSNIVSVASTYLKPGYGGYLDKEVYAAYIEMYNAAKKENLNILVQSPYRSYNTQSSIYNNYVKKDGKEKADTYSARAGYSEHQTALAIDFATKTTTGLSNSDFGQTKEFNWLKDNAYKYGFILRYPKGEEYITGYMYESWHYRYIGKEAAKVVHDENLTYEEYFTYYVLKK